MVRTPGRVSKRKAHCVIAVVWQKRFIKAGTSLQSIAGKFSVLWRCASERARAFVVACQATPNPNAAACLKQRLRRIRALFAVAAFVCQMGRKYCLSLFG